MDEKAYKLATDITKELNMPIGEYLRHVGMMPDEPCLISAVTAMHKAVERWFDKYGADPIEDIDGGYWLTCYPKHRKWDFAVHTGHIQFCLIKNNKRTAPVEVELQCNDCSLWHCIQDYCLYEYGDYRTGNPGAKELRRRRGKWSLPVKYREIKKYQRKQVREQYIGEQGGKCYHCKESLQGEPPKHITDLSIERMLKQTPGFLNYPIHLHHCHQTGYTIGVVHAYCNAVLWQYHGE